MAHPDSDRTPSAPGTASDHAAGMAARRRVLGDAWVDRALANTHAHNADFQDLITRYAWAGIWSRPALGDRTRRFMVLSMLLASRAYDEFALHARAALDGQPDSRLAPEDIQEVILQAAVYCGVPVANHASNVFSAILRERGLVPPASAA